MASLQKRKRGDKVLLYLDYSENGKRYQRSLGLFLYDKPKNRLERVHNEEADRDADSILQSKIIEQRGYRTGLVKQKNTDVIQGFKAWAANYSKKDINTAKAAVDWFVRYCTAQRVSSLPSASLEIYFIESYANWLDHQHTKYKRPMAKETKIKLFKKFKAYLNILYRDKYISFSPSLITTAWKNEKATVKKYTPTGEELVKLMSTPKPNETVCNAFIFCVQTAIDYKTVSNLTWGNIKDGYLVFTRSKVGKENKVKLNATALACLPEREHDEHLIFILPHHVTCVKWVRKWFKAAEIPNSERVTWHSARHTLGMILANEKGVKIEVIKEIYGHSSITETQKYVKAYNQEKDDAMDLLG